MKNFYQNNKQKANISAAVLAGALFLSYAHFCHAFNPLEGPIISAVGVIADLIVLACSWVLTNAIAAVISIAQYNKFIDNPQIKDAWIIIRDICNMFFILILLVIAFATILRVETYNAKKLLPKLIIMAVLINFSRTICGLLIDASQLVMLTFVNAFTDATGNFVVYFKIKEYLKIVEDNNHWISENPQTLTTTVGAILIAVVFLLVATIAMLAVLIVFAMRMIMLLLYVVLSPLAFLLSSFPDGAKYAQQWWGEFIKYLINGPILAFFIWLALITMANLDTKTFATTFAGPSGNVSILQPENFMSFILAIGFLVGGLMVSQQIGGIGASWGANTVKGLSQKGIGLAKGAAWKTTKFGLRQAKNLAGVGVDAVSMKAGIDFNVFRGIKRFQEQLKTNKDQRERDIYREAAKTADSEKSGRLRSGAALLSTGNLAWENLKHPFRDRFAAPRRLLMGSKNFYNKMDAIDAREKMLNEAKENVWTSEKQGEAQSKLDKKRKLMPEIDNAIQDAKNDIYDPKKKKAEKDEARAKLAHFENDRKILQEEINTLKTDVKRPVEDERAKSINDELVQAQNDRNDLNRFKITNIETAKAQAFSELIASGDKLIAHIDNSGQLGIMFEDAIRNQNPGLAAAIARKMTKNGDYNELMKQLNLGTGRDGMLQLGKILQKGGLDEQSSFGVLADMGTYAKNIKHFGAFGSVTMEHGKYRESTEDEYEAAKYAEKAKVQKQSFCRDTNRLGLGTYQKLPGDGEVWAHDKKHWVPDASTIALFRNPDYAQNYNRTKGTANLNAVGHLALHVDLLADNGAKAVADCLRGREYEAEADAMAAVKSVKK